MTEQIRDPRRAALSRDAALARLRRVTRASVAAAFALGGVFAALAAGSTQTKKTVVRAPARQPSPAPALAVAPAPPLVSAQAAQSAAQPAPASPAAAPTPSYAAPVVTSGGS